jgi:hypothetical protein
LAALLLALGSNFCGSAYAAATASATIEHISYTLVDLNPNDGIAPSVTFADDLRGAYSKATARGWDGIDGGEIFPNNASPGAFHPVGLAWTTSGTSFEAILSGDGTIGGSKFTAQASAFMDDRHHDGDIQVVLDSGKAKFTLSPMTAIRFPADSSVSAEVNGTPGRITSEFAYVWSGLTITREGFPNTEFDDGKNITLNSSTTKGIHPAHEMNTTALDLLYTNDTAIAFNGAVTASMTIYASSVAVIAVPEPATYLMFGAGLALLGLDVHRQRKAQP